MTFKDKPQRPGGKRPGGGKKPAGAPPASGGKPYEKKASGGKPYEKKATERKTFDRKPQKPVAPRPPAEAAASDKPERISKLIARAGVASRRDVERMIMEGRVKLNGKLLDTPVVNATLADRIEVDDMPIRGIERTRLWLYHKPAGLVTTNADPEGRPTVFDNLPEALPRVMSVGRLDINTEGLLLLTNDGGLARVLELPATGWLRRYRVRAHGAIDQAGLDRLREGIAVDGVLYGGIEATLDRTQGHNVWITMGLREGKNREIKNVLGALGLEVNRLIRISYGPFQLGDLPEGQALEVRGRTLRDQLGPRLIADANANFDAPIYDAPVAEDAPQAEGWQAEKPARDRKDHEKPGREKPAYEKPVDRRERALGRLDTRRDETRGERKFGKDRREGDRRDGERRDDGRRGGEGRFGGPEREKRFEAPRKRNSNVWMAPGARPVVEKAAAEGETAPAGKRVPRTRPEGAPATKRYGRTKDGLATRTTAKHDPDRKGGRPQAFRDTGPRVRVTRVQDEGEWIRAEAPAVRRDDADAPRRSRDSGDRKPRDFGDRPPRDFGDRKPRGERPFGDRDRGGKEFGGERPARPARNGDKPFHSSKSGGDKPFHSGKPGGDRPFRSDKPGGGKPFAGKPGGAKSFGGKPSGGKPSGGGKPFGGKGDGRPGGGRTGGGKGMSRGADRRR